MSLKKSSDTLQNLQELNHFVDRLPVSTETKTKIFGAMVKMVRSSLSINDIIHELEQIVIVPVNQDIGDVSYDDICQNVQEKLTQLLDKFWLMVDEEHAVPLFEACQNIREIFNDTFSILTKQGNELINLKHQVENMQVSHDELLLGSLATQLVIKMSRFKNTNEHPSIAACKTVSMIMTQTHVEQLKAFLENNGYNLQEICLAIQVLKRIRNIPAHPNDPSTSPTDIQKSIDRLFPSESNPKRAMAQKVLHVLEILSKQQNESIFLKID